MKRTPLRSRKKGLKTKTKLKAINPKRKKRLYEQQFGDYAELIRALPCCICRRPGPSDPSHIRGGSHRKKENNLVPHCRACHTYYEEHKREWNEKYQLPALAIRLWTLYEQMQKTGVAA